MASLYLFVTPMLVFLRNQFWVEPFFLVFINDLPDDSPGDRGGEGRGGGVKLNCQRGKF